VKDRELLEFAALAARIEIELCTCSDERFPFKRKDGKGHWSPLHDDGDALRLSAKLGIGYSFGLYDGIWKVDAGRLLSKPMIESVAKDPSAAIRRAIVRAAAEIGKGMTANVEFSGAGTASAGTES